MKVYQKVGKRSLDLVLAFGLAIVILPPVLVVFGLLIKMESEGPILFKQKRLGKGGKWFTIFKLRSMYLNNDGRPCVADDPRVTKIGWFIRKYKIDELPQLINVIKGDMSLVGPRPFSMYYYGMVEDHNLAKTRLLIKPGMTGAAQIKDDLTISDFPIVAKIDGDYVRNCSLMLDAKIMWETAEFLLERIKKA